MTAGLTSDVLRTVDLPVAEPVKPVPHTEHPLAEQRTAPGPAPFEAVDATWPRGGTATVAAGASPRRAGDLPVTVAVQAGEKDIEVVVADQSAAQRAGVVGVVLAVTPSEDADASMSVGVDYSAFRNAVGGEFGSRLRLERLPACALTTPESAQCQVREPLPSRNDSAAKTVTAELAAEPVVLAATADGEGPNGTYEASALAPSGTWSVGGNSGTFGWSYPIELPSLTYGKAVAPTVALSYSSSTVDGRTMATNNQAGAIGQGWGFSPGSIERTYRSCSSDKTLPQEQRTGDLCWAGQIVTMNLEGQAAELVYEEATNTWKSASDGGARIELLTGAANGVNGGEYWKVTNTSGVSYYFGRNRGPGYTDQEQTNSAWTVPVYGPRSGDKCHNPSGFAASWCNQAWRWNLDFVEDTQGNVTSYYYTPENNHYGANKQTTGVSYTRGGWLKRIDYGLRNVNGSIYGGVVPHQVVFDVTERCQPSAEFDCDPAKFTAANAKYWPDVPQDQECKAGAVCNVHSPSYWSTKRLTTITTQYNQGSGPVKVDQYSLGQQLPHHLDTVKELLLTSITRKGFQGTTSIELPPLTFAYQSMDNRVVGYRDNSAMAHKRLTEIQTDTGSAIRVTYSPVDCAANNVPTDLVNNTRRCFPVYWTLPFNQDPTLDFFHKYVVEKVVTQDLGRYQDPNDRRTTSPDQVSTYTYLGTPAWHYDDFELVRPEHRTYGQFRGYAKVEKRTGDPAYKYDDVADRQTLTRTTYFRGMDGDTLPSNGRRTATVTNSLGETVTDQARFAGAAFEEEVFNGDGGPRVSSTITEPTIVGTTATRTRTGLPPLTAVIVAETRKRTITDLAGGGTRTATTTSRYDALGRLTHSTESGDGVPDLCTRTTYADNTTAWVRDRVAETVVSQQVCPADGVAQTDILSAKRTYYDQQATLGQVTTGNAFRTDSATADTGGQLTFATTGTVSYDATGRLLTTTDALQRTTRVAYTPADGGVLTKTVTTNAKNQTSTVEVEPARGKTTAAIDVGGRRHDVVYDALGRVVEVWKPGQIRRAGGGSPATTYEYTVRTNGPLAVTTRTLVDYRTGLNYLTKIDVFDSLGQLRSTQSEALDGTANRVVKDVFYDSLGRVRHSYNRYATTGAPSTTLLQVGPSEVDDRTVTEYDGAGRATLTTAYKGLTPTWKTRTVHGGDRTTVFPPHGSVTRTTITDVRGRVIESRDYTAAPIINGDTVSGGAFQAATREYTPLGKLAKVNDTVGNHWTFGYDLMGRKTSQTDPDAGASSTTYDLAGQILTTTDARGQKLAFTYDELGRRTGEFVDSTAGTRLTTWSYDNAENGVGLPGFTTRHTPNGLYRTGPSAYDGQGLIARSITQLPSSETGLSSLYTTKFGFTSTGQLVTVEQPTAGGLPGEVVTTRYNKYGLPNATDGSNVYVSASTYTAFGEAQQLTLGPEHNRATLTYRYDEQTRRLAGTNLTAQAADGQIDDTGYSYDPSGNVTKTVNTQGRTGQAPVRTQCYNYDALRRLTNAWTATDDCAASPTTTPGHANIGGPTPYWTSWTFEPSGLRATQTQHALPGATGDTTTTYTYPNTGAARPHALTSATTSGPSGSTLSSYDYDPAGNTTRRTQPSGEHTFTWDRENRLDTVTSPGGTTKYVYDADGNQLVRKDPGKTTLYLPGQEFTRDNSSGVITATRYYLHGGSTVALRVSGTNPVYVVSDLHGTNTLAVQSVGFATSRRTFDPYGNQLNPVEGLPWPDRHGFLNKPVSETTGLTDIGARKYDAFTGRFISVDPILDLDNPQQWTGYVYADNNPTTFSDPTGLIRQCGVDGAGCGARNYDKSNAYNEKVNKVNNLIRSIQGHAAKSIKPTARDNCKGVSSYVAMQTSCGSSRTQTATSEYPKCAECRNGPWSREKLQMFIDMMGVAVPAIGDGADLANCGIHAAYGEWGDASLSCAAAVPIVGIAAGLAKMAKNGQKLADTAGDGKAAVKCANSFTGDTHVLMADGTTKPIDQIKVGDKVTNSEPESAETEQHVVLAVIVTDADKDYADLTIATPDGNKTIRATAHHPIYNATAKRWVDADDLKPGDQLTTPGNGRATIEATRLYTATLRNYNLTVEQIHTYYVLAGTTPVVVHNSGPCGISTRHERAGDIGNYTDGQKTRDPASQWYHEELSNDELLDGINNPAPGDGILVSRDGKILGGHHRKDELIARIKDGRIDPNTQIRIDVYEGE
ncbi:RHS repeat-associated core domain-containing protein [Saccharothrix mutabilis subsp. mutabilis]|uniref:RHS repeat-associated core domain-containing protein n=1 Tax=Saccharothrix mutabilis subsp. mutabilis TaxID=66855 RepID=A0ABP3ECA3_9PSEU